jgi:hypothetical protein
MGERHAFSNGPQDPLAGHSRKFRWAAWLTRAAHGQRGARVTRIVLDGTALLLLVINCFRHHGHNVTNSNFKFTCRKK